MANIGLSRPTFAKLNPDGTYSDGIRLSKAVNINLNVNWNTASVSGDNVIAESTREFKDGTIDLGIISIPVAAYDTVFGHEVTTDEDGTVTIVDKTDDIAHYGGTGFVIEDIDNGEKVYVAVWLKKTQFSETSMSATTKGEAITFQTPTLSGTILALDDKTWRERKIFKTEQAAYDYIDEIAGIEPGTPEV